MGNKRALVLSGGSIKGAFQAGAMAELLESDFVPDVIYGTSVGSLNGGFLAERAGRTIAKGEEPDWPQLGRTLENFWLEEIHSPSQVGIQRKLLPLVFSVLCSDFKGLINVAPLRRLVQEQIDPENLRLAPVSFYACAVNLVTGEAVYASEDYAGILDYIIASTAIPIEMPYVEIGKAPYVDGGVREVAPLQRAIDDGADEVVCITCQPERLEGANFRPGNLPEFAMRLMEVVTNELLNNDLRRRERINHWVKTFDDVKAGLDSALGSDRMAEAEKRQVDDLLERLPFRQWQSIPITVIRPANEIDLGLMDFTMLEIAKTIKLGRDVAKRCWETSRLPCRG